MKDSLLIRMPNWVGDVLMALPVIEAFKNNDIELQLLGRPWMKVLLEALDIPILSLSNHFWQDRNEIVTLENTNKALLLTNSFSSALMTRLAGFESIGYKTDARQILLKAGLQKNLEKHEVEVFYDIGRFACEYWFPEKSWPKRVPKISLPISEISIVTAQNALERAKIQGPFWVLCPFAHGTGKNNASKIWPHWAELSRMLAKEHPLVVVPGKNEEALCQELVPEATILPGLNLSEYAALLSLGQRVIANDSGPMHLASAVGAQVLGIFGVSSPKRTSPWGGEYIGAAQAWPTLQQVIRRCLSYGM